MAKLADVRRIYLPLPEPLNVAYALGALAGLRTGEVFALRSLHVHLQARRIHVRESVKGPLKDKDSRAVPILDRLLPVRADWKLRTGGEGRAIPPLRCDGQNRQAHAGHLPPAGARRARPLARGAPLGHHRALRPPPAGPLHGARSRDHRRVATLSRAQFRRRMGTKGHRRAGALRIPLKSHRKCRSRPVSRGRPAWPRLTARVTRCHAGSLARCVTSPGITGRLRSAVGQGLGSRAAGRCAPSVTPRGSRAGSRTGRARWSRRWAR